MDGVNNASLGNPTDVNRRDESESSSRGSDGGRGEHQKKSFARY